MTILRMHGSLGDEIAFTGFVREFRRAHPHDNLGVSVSRPVLFEKNPHLSEKPTGPVLNLTWEPCNVVGNFVRGWGRVTDTRIIDDSPEIFFCQGRWKRWSGSVPPNQRFVLIDTWAGWPSRRWPLDRWRELVRQLEGLGMLCMEVGASTADCTGAVRPIGRVCRENIVDATDIKQIAERIRDCRLLIASDSGLVHLAAALGAPHIAIYGPRRWYSRAYRSTYPIYSLTEDCEGCGEHCHHGRRCMLDIHPEQIVDTIRHFAL